MIGQGVLRECLLDPDIKRVVTVGRNAVGNTHPKLRNVVAKDLFDLSAVEQELTNVGLLYLVDPETGRQLRVDTRSRRLRERFAVAAAAERAEIARSLSSAGVRHVVLTTSGDWLRPLVTFLRRSRS